MRLGGLMSQDKSPLKGELLEPHPAETLEEFEGVLRGLLRLNVDG